MRIPRRLRTAARRRWLTSDQIDMEMLARSIAAQIQACNGSLVRNASEVGDVDLWRRAARKAGRVLGVPIRTGVAPDGSRVWAVDNS